MGQRIYLAVTVAMGCFLGVGLALSAEADALTQAYGLFAEEAKAHQPDYAPESVNLDGWDATRIAWTRLFPTIVVMRCFLHTVLGIQQRCRSNKPLFRALTHRLWHLFHSLSPAQFGQRLRRLGEWAKTTPDLPQTVLEQLAKLKAKAPQFKLTFQHPNAHRTSNMVDRLMNHQDRLLYAMQYFHGSTASAQLALRAMALLWNFHPYGRKTQANKHSRSPFEDLNGFQYHDHWLRNLLIASSLNGRNAAQPLPHLPNI